MKSDRPPRKSRRKSAEIVQLPYAKAPPPGAPAQATEPPPRAAKPGPAAWKPNKAEKRLVEVCAAIGMTLPQTATVLGKSVKSIQRRCAEEWKTGMARINAKVAGKLIEKALGGDTASLIFFAKTRLGWSEKQLHELTGRDGGPIVYDKVKRDADDFVARMAAIGARQAPSAEPIPAELASRTIN